MSSHLRRLTPSERNALPGATDADRFLSWGAVCVGTSGGDYLVHVAGDDRPGLPGAFEAADYAGLHTATRKNVLEAEWEAPSDPEDPESEPVRCRGKVAEIPAGIEPTTTNIEPHHFA